MNAPDPAGNELPMRLTFGALGLLAIMTTCAAAWGGEGLHVDVDGPDAPRVRAAIEREVSAITPAPRGTLDVHRGEDDVAKLSYVSEDGRRKIDRTLQLQSEPEQAADEIALVAASMMRDEPETPPAPPPAAPPDGPPPPRSSDDLCHSRAVTVPVGGDLFPYLGTSLYAPARTSSRVFVLSATAGVGAALSGFAIGGIADIETDYACGVEISGIANVVRGPVRGAQIGGVGNFVSGDLVGAQIAGVVNTVGGDFEGVAIGGVANVAPGDLTGLQIGGVMNFAGGAVHGAQIGGVINYASGRVHGVQIGLVNVAEKSDFAIGLLNINTKGRTELELTSEVESGIVSVMLKHGGDRWHTIYGVGARLTQPTPIATLGFGAHMRMNDRMFVDLDFMDSWFVSFKNINLSTELVQARPTLGIKLLDGFAVVGGPTWNLLVAEKPAVNWAPSYATAVDTGSNLRVRSWPGVSVGVQVFTD